MRNLFHSTLMLAAMLSGCAPTGTTPSTPISSALPSTHASAAPTEVPSAAPTAAAGFMLSGRVYDDDLKAIEADVVALAEGQAPVAGRAGADGRYQLRVPAGTYQVTASKAGWLTRTQTVTVSQDATVDFGGISDAGANPYFLSNTPEVSRVEAVEPAPAGPLTLKFHFSEPITAAGQNRFMQRLYVTSGDTKPLLYGSGSVDSIFKTEASWDASGQVFSLIYKEPYLASGAAATPYTVRLEQGQTNDIDPITRERLWDPLGVPDAEGNELGQNRADFVFLNPQLFTISIQQMSNEDFGKTHSRRRWALTHQSTFTWAAKRDDVPPTLVSARATVGRRIGESIDDVVELTLSEPMRVVRNQTDTQYTLLTRENQLAIVNVSDSANGTNPKALNAVLSKVSFSRTEPNVVYLHYPRETFKGRQWVEVILGPDMKDPVGNGPDAQKNRASGAVN